MFIKTKFVKVVMVVVVVAALLMGIAGCGQEKEVEQESSKAVSETAVEESNADTEETQDTEKAEETKEPLDYPKGDVKIIVPGKTGGTADIVTRILARYLTEQIDTQVIVENKPGAGTLIALTEYLNEKPNTHTLQVFFNGVFTLDPYVSEEEVPVKLDDFQPVVGMDANKRVLYVNTKTTGIESYEDLIEYGKENFIIYGTGNKNNQADILQGGLFKINGIEAELTISKDALAALLGNHLTTVVDTPTKGASFIREGSIKPILVFSDEPITLEGIEVPTAKSKGLEIAATGYRFIGISKGTDQEIVDFWHNEIAKVYENSDFVNELAELGVVMVGGNQDAVIETIQGMYKDHGMLIEKINE